MILDQYEQRINDLERELQTQKEHKESVINKGNQNNGQSISYYFDSVASFSSRHSLHGFATVGVSTTDADVEYVVDTTDTLDADNPDFRSDTMIGLQYDFTVNDATAIYFQFKAEGAQDFEPAVEWLYLSHDINDSLMLRAGRLRLPAFLMSEYVEVGYSYPWVRPPVEVYSTLPFSNYDGFSLWHQIPAFKGVLQTQFYYGTVDFETSFDHSHITIQQAYGMTLEWSKTDLTIQASYSTGKLNTDDDEVAALNNAMTGFGLEPFLADEAQGRFGSVGFIYDDGIWFVSGEAIAIDVDDSVFADQRANTLTVGRRFGDWLPYASYGRHYTTDEKKNHDAQMVLSDISNQLSAGISTINAGLSPLDAYIATLDPTDPADIVQYLAAVNQQEDALMSLSNDRDNIGAVLDRVQGQIFEQRSYSIGLRYELAASYAVKLEYSYLTDFDGTRGRFRELPGDSAEVYTFVIDTVF